ncbi:Methyl-CpG-binding domain-containing protein 8 [Linum grandiflorum]
MATFSAVVNASSSLVSGDQHPTHNNLPAESLPLIDLRLLSQFKLLPLSLCSSTFSSVRSLHNDTDLSTPRIDRSVFNESAGTRKQTFSRLRLAPRNTSTSNSHLLRPPLLLWRLPYIDISHRRVVRLCRDSSRSSASPILATVRRMETRIA